MSKLVKIDTTNLPYTNYIIGGAIVYLALIALVYLFRNNLPPEIPLYYGKPQGEGQLASTLALMVPSLLALLILIINSIIAYFSKEEFIKKILILSSLVVGIFAATTTLEIVFLVGSF